ncbi:MAG TPA: hypothetical protein VIN59_04430 [Alphaproteobacteria bacterium]
MNVKQPYTQAAKAGRRFTVTGPEHAYKKELGGISPAMVVANAAAHRATVTNAATNKAGIGLD